MIYSQRLRKLLHAALAFACMERSDTRAVDHNFDGLKIQPVHFHPHARARNVQEASFSSCAMSF